MHDWMTITIEVVGIVILCVWTVVPIREFGQILRRIRAAEDKASREQPAVKATETTGN